MDRSSGILLPIFSIPSKYGIGTLGKKAYEFIDFLSDTSQSYWQILPINPLASTSSPYQSTSLFAFNIYYIDFEKLAEDKLLYKNEYEKIFYGEDKNKVDYDSIIKNKEKILMLAADRFLDKQTDDYIKFKNEFAYYLDGYVLYKTLKKLNNNLPFYDWEDNYKYGEYNTIENFKKDYSILMEKYKILEYFFYKQWIKLKQYANSKNIKIIGDMPIYSGYDSSDCYIDKLNFQFDENLNMKAVSGCPPDNYNAEGQLWMNPLFNYDYIKTNNYQYVIRKVAHLSNFYDVIRLDHFRGYQSFFSIPATDKNAKNGHWEKGPGIDLFNNIKNQVPNAKFIAEDLGFLDDDVRKLLYDTGFPGMKVLQFGFEGNKGNIDVYNPYLVENYNENTVAYIDTHDNNTLLGWLDSIDEKEKECFINYINDRIIINKKNEEINKKTIDVIMKSRSNLVILSMQDLLGLGSEARINTPGTVNKDNWSYRFDENYINENIKKFLREITIESGRNN